MDWQHDLKTDVWVFPRGMTREGAAGPQSLRWESTYGSVIAAGFNSGTADGMNEMSLVANRLYLAESGYEAASGKLVIHCSGDGIPAQTAMPELSRRIDLANEYRPSKTRRSPR